MNVQDSSNKCERDSIHTVVGTATGVKPADTSGTSCASGSTCLGHASSKANGNPHAEGQRNTDDNIASDEPYDSVKDKVHGNSLFKDVVPSEDMEPAKARVRDLVADRIGNSTSIPMKTATWRGDDEAAVSSWSDTDAASSSSTGNGEASGSGDYYDASDTSGDYLATDTAHGVEESNGVCWSPITADSPSVTNETHNTHTGELPGGVMSYMPKRGAGIKEGNRVEEYREEEEEDAEDAEDGQGDALNDILDDFARELDGSSCDEEEPEDAETGTIGRDRLRVSGSSKPARGVGVESLGGAAGAGGQIGALDEAEDAGVARALQEEEWLRATTPITGTFELHPRPNPAYSYTTECDTSTSIFNTKTSATGVDNTTSRRFSGCSGSLASTTYDLSDGGADTDRDKRRKMPPLSPRTSRQGHARSWGGGTGHEDRGGGTCRGDGRGTSGFRDGKAPGRRLFLRKGAGMPPAWPPGGLKDGEGLPLNDLPDEILDKIAAFTLFARSVSRRFQCIRVKVVRERVISALESSAKLPPERAEQVEEAIFALLGGLVGKAYKAKAREMSFNLREGKNDPLRAKVLSGALLPYVLVRMSSDELAPLSVRRERERIAQKRIREVTSSRDSPNHTVTNRFTCPECGHERTQYRTWRRKAVVDRVRVIVQCLQCRHSWEL